MIAPAGAPADGIAALAGLLFGGGALIFGAVMLLLVLALWRQRPALNERRWILVGGLLLPSLALAALFFHAAERGAALAPPVPAGALAVSVTAHQFWWAVRYAGEGADAPADTANELRIPVGRPVHLALQSADVIHSFWVPALAGKMDMLPGRVTHLVLRADRPGRYRGQCAEFCGLQHARMAFDVIALQPAEFERWLALQREPAREPDTPLAIAGRDAFVAQRCLACHAVRGLGNGPGDAPDLTHVGGRLALGAGTLRGGPHGLARWIAHAQQEKPGVEMPSYAHLGDDTVAAIAAYLAQLQ